MESLKNPEGSLTALTCLKGRPISKILTDSSNHLKKYSAAPLKCLFV